MGFLAAFLAVFAYVVGGSNSEVTDEPPRYIEAREKEPVSQVGRGGTARLVFPVSMKPDCLNPYLPGCRGAKALGGVVFEGLFALGPSGEYKPVLAAGTPSYADETLSLEPMTIEVRLRENAAFSDGEAVTSADVEWTYEQAAALADTGKMSPLYSGFSRLEEVEAEGPKTVTLTFEEPYSEWRTLLTAPVLPEHVYGEREFAALPLVEEPVGSGPFLLDEMSESAINFSASARYWREQLEFPRLDGLEIVFKGPSDSAESLSSGRVDFGFFTQPASAPDAGSLLRSEAARTRTELLVFNSRTLDDGLRQALIGDVNRRKVAFEAGPKATDAAFTGIEAPPEGAWSNQNSSTSSPAESLRLVYPAGGPARDRAARSVVEQLGSSGVEVEAERVSPGEFFRETLPSGSFDLAITDFGSLTEYESLTPFLPEDSSQAVLQSLAEMDEQGQYLARTQRVMADENALLPLYVWPDSYAWSSTLSGPAPDASQRAVLWNIREWGFFK